MEPLKVLYHDAWMAVCVKPHGAESEHELPQALTAQLGLSACFCVHRLDRDTGGVMVYALNGKAAARLTELFAGHGVEKEYLAVCEGTPAEPEAVLRDLLWHDARRNRTYIVDRMRGGVKEAVLRYTLRKSLQDPEGNTLSLLQIRLETGRSHQIRVQLAGRKMPIAGDRKYGAAARYSPFGLWCRSLRFAHPFTGKALSFAVEPDAAVFRLFDEA